MAGKISVIGNTGVTETIAPGARGADVIVAASADGVADALRLAPAAVVLLVDAAPDEVGAVLDATLVPRQRVLGVARGDVERAAQAAAAGPPVTLGVTLRDGEREVTLGRGGVIG